MIITIAGAPASGKGTIGKILSAKLGFPAYSTGQMWRDKAREHGMNMEEFAVYMENHPEEENKFEDMQREMARTRDNFIIDSRLAWFCMPQSIKVFLDVDIDVAAKRRFAQEETNRAERAFTSVEEVKRLLLYRHENELKRYGPRLGITSFDKSKFDIVIDTTKLTPEQVANAILDAIKKMGYQLPPSATQ